MFIKIICQREKVKKRQPPSSSRVPGGVSWATSKSGGSCLTRLGVMSKHFLAAVFLLLTSSGVLVGRSALDLDRNTARLCWWEWSRDKEVNHYLCRRNLLPKFYDLSVMCVCARTREVKFSFGNVYGFTFDGWIWGNKFSCWCWEYTCI